MKKLVILLCSALLVGCSALSFRTTRQDEKTFVNDTTYASVGFNKYAIGPLFSAEGDTIVLDNVQIKYTYSKKYEYLSMDTTISAEKLREYENLHSADTIVSVIPRAFREYAKFSKTKFLLSGPRSVFKGMTLFTGTEIFTELIIEAIEINMQVTLTNIEFTLWSPQYPQPPLRVYAYRTKNGIVINITPVKH